MRDDAYLRIYARKKKYFLYIEFQSFKEKIMIQEVIQLVVLTYVSLIIPILFKAVLDYARIVFNF